MTKLPENNSIVKIRFKEWFFSDKKKLSRKAKEIFLYIECFVQILKTNSNELYWKIFFLQTSEDVTGFGVCTSKKVSCELLEEGILSEQSDPILVFGLEKA